MGILEDIKASLESLHEKIDALGTGTAAAPAATKAAAKKTPAKTEAAKPAFTAEQLRDKYLEVQGKHGDVFTKGLIAEQGHDKLAKLIADSDNWQKYWDAAEAALEADADGDDDGGL